MTYVVRKIHGRIWSWGFHVLLISDKKILAYDADKTQEKEISALQLLNFTD